MSDLRVLVVIERTHEAGSSCHGRARVCSAPVRRHSEHVSRQTEGPVSAATILRSARALRRSCMDKPAMTSRAQPSRIPTRRDSGSSDGRASCDVPLPELRASFYTSIRRWSCPHSDVRRLYSYDPDSRRRGVEMAVPRSVPDRADQSRRTGLVERQTLAHRPCSRCVHCWRR